MIGGATSAPSASFLASASGIFTFTLIPARLIVLPVLIPLVAGVVNVLVHKPRSAQKAVNVAALLLNVAAAFWIFFSVYAGPGLPPRVIDSQMGNWPAPYGISVTVDTLSASLLVVTSLVALLAYVWCLTQMPARFEGGYFHALFPLLLLGVDWAFVAGDLFNLFVSFEVMLMASYALLVVGTTPRQMRQAYKYVVLNLIASTAFVTACGWVYGTLGTLNMAELAQLSQSGQVGGRAALAVCTLAFVFAAKGAAFPLWFWLPDAYPTLPSGLGALYAALLTKVGVYALLRVVLMCFGGSVPAAAALAPVLLGVSAATMFVGGVGMCGAATLRKVIANGILVGVGYMTLGVALALDPHSTVDPAGAAAGTVFYMSQHMLVLACLMLCCGLVERHAGTDVLRDLGGLMKRDVPLAIIFFVAALSLVGLPPLAGFFGKYLLVKAAFARGGGWGYAVGGVAIAAGVLSLLAMGRAWCLVFWMQERPTSRVLTPTRRGWGLATAGGLLALTLPMGLYAQPFADVAAVAGRGVTEPQNYIDAVLHPIPFVPEAIEPPLRKGAFAPHALAPGLPLVESQRPVAAAEPFGATWQVARRDLNPGLKPRALGLGTGATLLPTHLPRAPDTNETDTPHRDKRKPTDSPVGTGATGATGFLRLPYLLHHRPTGCSPWAWVVRATRGATNAIDLSPQHAPTPTGLPVGSHQTRATGGAP